MKLKKLISLFLIACLALGTLAGCSDADLKTSVRDSIAEDGRSLAGSDERTKTVLAAENSVNIDEIAAPEPSPDDVCVDDSGAEDGISDAAFTVANALLSSDYATDLETQLVNFYISEHYETVSAYAAANPDLFDDETDPDTETFDLSTIDLSTIEFLKLYYNGVSDPTVAYIQQLLMDLGFMESAEPTQYYGSITTQAVKLFQRQNELKEDGVLGEESLGILLSGEAKHYTAKLGMVGDDIKRIQQRLYELGYLDSKKSINGRFDESTDKAVKALQSANWLDADGKVGEMTIELMYSDEVVANLLSFGDRSDVVLECQKRLKELGYLTTAPDGNYGNDTLAAVKLFQSRNNLVVDGYLGPSTRDVLDSGSAVPNGLLIGDEGDTVKRVQQLLIKYGYMSNGSDTGYFGEVTDKAVKAFQKKNGLSVDGNVGAKTMAKLTGSSVVKANDTTTGGGGGNGGGAVDTGYAGSGSVEALLKVALSKLGCKYVWGAKGPNQFDCSGFVYWCLNQVGVKQSYITSKGWRTVGKYKKITNYSSLKAGDIIVVTGHVGIIGENGTVIDASSSQGKICHRKLSSWWSSRFICGWRIFE
ncbi:MAG: peptidoglycan-binding protein [Lachnospiraceae bacterium]|nr:peptidoglycan-binding protein [Lachnospiraceae bacterium]